jgi:hypothetical protein
MPKSDPWNRFHLPAVAFGAKAIVRSNAGKAPRICGDPVVAEAVARGDRTAKVKAIARASIGTTFTRSMADLEATTTRSAQVVRQQCTLAGPDFN